MWSEVAGSSACDAMLLLLLTLLLIPVVGRAQVTPYTCAYSSPPLEQPAPLLLGWSDLGRETGNDPGCQDRHDQEAQRLRKSVLQGLGEYVRCGPLETRPRVEGCRVVFTADPGWADMLHRADSIGIWALSSPPEEEPGLDGVAVAVELRDRAGYRSFSYSSPSASAGPGRREVAAMWDLLDSALAAAHAQLGGK
jgi:hypothetical protein